MFEYSSFESPKQYSRNEVQHRINALSQGMPKTLTYMQAKTALFWIQNLLSERPSSIEQFSFRYDNAGFISAALVSGQGKIEKDRIECEEYFRLNPEN